MAAVTIATAALGPQTNSPCVFGDRKRSLTSWGRSACTWTQTAPWGTAAGCSDRSDAETKKISQNVGEASGTVPILIEQIWNFFKGSPRSSAPATDSQPGPEEIQGPALWSARVGCSARRSPLVHRKKDGPSKAPWIGRKKRKNNTDVAQIFRLTLIIGIKLIMNVAEWMKMSPQTHLNFFAHLASLT